MIATDALVDIDAAVVVVFGVVVGIVAESFFDVQGTIARTTRGHAAERSFRVDAALTAAFRAHRTLFQFTVQTLVQICGM